MSTPIKVGRRALKNDYSQESHDFTNRSQISEGAQEIWLVAYSPTDPDVIAAGNYVDAETARTAPGLPTGGYNSTGPLSGKYVNNIRAQRVSPFIFDVYIDWTAQTIPGGAAAYWSTTCSITSATTEEKAEKDRTGQPFCNTVGDLLPQLPTVSIYDDLVTITFSTLTPPDFSPIKGKTNADIVNFTIAKIHRTYTADQMLCVKADFRGTKTTLPGSTGTPTGQIQFDCELAFWIRKDTWRWKSPNVGWYGMDDNENYVLFKDPAPNGGKNPVPCSTWSNLDYDGHRLDQGTLPIFLPDDAKGKSSQMMNCPRNFDDPGAFIPYHQATFTPFLQPIDDTVLAIGAAG